MMKNETKKYLSAGIFGSIILLFMGLFFGIMGYLQWHSWDMSILLLVVLFVVGFPLGIILRWMTKGMEKALSVK
jgi:ABC-type multidrug transport system permease subunit